MRIFVRVLSLSLALSAALTTVQAQELTFGPGASAASRAKQQASGLDSIVAVVNDDIITRRELENATASFRAKLRERKREEPAGLERQVLERLILNQLQLRAAEREGIKVDDQTLTAAMQSVAQRNNLSLAQLRATLEKDGYSFSEFSEDIRRELLINQLRQRAVDKRIQISDAEVDNFLASAEGQQLGVEFHLAQIVVAVGETATADQVQKAAARASSLTEQMRKGGDFAKAAGSVSAGREALDGGDLGWRGIDRIPAPFLPLLMRMKTGDVSEPVRSPRGFHIFKLLEKRGSPDAANSTAARNLAREALARQKAEEEWDSWLQRLRASAFVDIRDSGLKGE